MLIFPGDNNSKSVFLSTGEEVKMNVLCSPIQIQSKIYEPLINLIRFYEENKIKEVVVIGVLNGCLFLLNDLVSNISRMANKIEMMFDFVQVSSYGEDTQTCGQVKLLKDVCMDLNEKNVLIVDDIADTGLSIQFLKDLFLNQYKINTLKTFVAVKKHKCQVEIDYSIFNLSEEFDDKFLIGYGMDYKKKLRDLNSIYYLIK